MARTMLAVLAAALLLAGCAAEEAPPAAPPTPDGDEEAVMDLSGTFTGDPRLEGGCAWVEGPDGDRYEVVWPQGFEVRWDPLELRGPDGDLVAADGDEVRVLGRIADDLASICMVGPILEADEVESR